MDKYCFTGSSLVCNSQVQWNFIFYALTQAHTHTDTQICAKITVSWSVATAPRPTGTISYVFVCYCAHAGCISLWWVIIIAKNWLRTRRQHVASAPWRKDIHRRNWYKVANNAWGLIMCNYSVCLIPRWKCQQHHALEVYTILWKLLMQLYWMR